MNISERIISIKRHSIGYVIDGAEYTRNQAIKLAQRGYVTNARVVESAAGDHLVGANGTTLYNLPTRIGEGRRFASARRK
jgi:hypothetical protein